MPNFSIAHDYRSTYLSDTITIELLKTLLDIPQDVAGHVVEKLAGNRGWAITSQELESIRGIGQKRARKLLAAIEFAKQIGKSQVDPGTVIDAPSIAAEVLRPYICFSDVEQFGVISMDIKHHIIAVDVTAIGTVRSVEASPREIYLTALRRGAFRIIVGHSHPSGNPEPSSEDITVTGQIINAGRTLNINCLDHLVVCQSEYHSIRESHVELWAEGTGQEPHA